MGADNSADLFGNAALAADDLAHIVRRDTQLQRQLVLSLLPRESPTPMASMFP